MQVGRWGNSLAVRLPRDVVGRLGLKDGDNVTVEAIGATSFQVSREMAIEDAEAAIRGLRRPLPEGWKFDRDEANER